MIRMRKYLVHYMVCWVLPAFQVALLLNILRDLLQSPVAPLWLHVGRLACCGFLTTCVVASMRTMCRWRDLDELGPQIVLTVQDAGDGSSLTVRGRAEMQ